MALHQRKSRATMILIHSLFFLLLVPWFTFAQGSTPSAPPSYDRIHRLTDQGKFDEALSALNEISKSNPGAKNLSHEFGIIYYRKGDYLTAISSFQRAIAENPNDNEATQLTGLSLYLAGRPSEAIPYLEKVQSW
jgi:tetratricopeptide (TPR) repeat protein